jgi:MFS family permease
MLRLLNFFNFNSQFQSSEDKSFYRFYVLQLLLFSAGLARGTAIGFVLYKLGVTPQALGLMTSIAMIGMLLGYWSSPYIHQIFKKSYLVFNFAQYAVALSSLLLMTYIINCFYNNNWGNFWVWTAMSTIGSFLISVEQSSRPFFVKKSFPNINFSKIMRQDVLTMGVAKVLGFATGAIIISKLWVFFIFLFGFLISIAMIQYVKKVSQKPVIPLLETLSVSLVVEKKISYLITVGLHLITCLILFPINTQAITYAKIWNIPFYWFYICGSLGNVFFNIVINPRVGMGLGKSYVFYMVCLISGFTLFLTSSHGVLLGSFLVGGSYSSLNVLASSRLYEGTNKSGRNLISRFYLIGSFGCIIGSYMLGLSLEKLDKNTVFSILIVISIVAYGSLALFTHKTNKH